MANRQYMHRGCRLLVGKNKMWEANSITGRCVCKLRRVNNNDFNNDIAYQQAHTLYSRSFASSSSLPPIDDGAGQPALLKTTGGNGVHDVGGLESLLGEPIDLSDPALQDWEQETHALLIALIRAGYLTTDELRRHIEAMQDDHYIYRSYYCKWATSMALGLLERGIISFSELDHALLGAPNDPANDSFSRGEPKFSVGQHVKVRKEESMGRWRKPHLRTPGYIFGMTGIVESNEGFFPDPSYKAFRSTLVPHQRDDKIELERKENLYRVRFSQSDIWPERKTKHKEMDSFDTVTVEIYENWLTEVTADAPSDWEIDPSSVVQDNKSPSRNYNHDHNHDHEHLSREELEQRAIELEVPSALCSTGSIQEHPEATTTVGDTLSSALIYLLSQPERLGSSLKSELRRIVDTIESIRIRSDGATLVVRAWMDPSFEERLLQDAASAALELGINTVNATAPTKLKVVKSELPSNSHPGVHNLVTCTLCSCYPLSLLGLSPKWYKSRSFRARAVREPRAMLRDSFGLDLPLDQWTLRVHDSTADLRYLVLPPRPPHTEGWAEENLRRLVTRDTMIGVALPAGILAS